MEDKKKLIFGLTLFALLGPFLLTFTPVNRLSYDWLTLHNDTPLENPAIPWKKLLIDSLPKNPSESNIGYEKSNLAKKDSVLNAYTSQVENYKNQNFGLRPFYVKIKNQLDFSLFNKANAKDVIRGEENFLYEEQYIDSYYGKNFVGKKEIKTKTALLKQLQDYLAEEDRLVMVVIAPGKGFYYPEYIPEDYRYDKSTTNYEEYVTEFRKQGINFIDFNQIYLDEKSTSKHTLYPKAGIHWSQHGMYHSVDSIINYISYKRDTILNDLVIKNEAPSNLIRFSDDDMEKALNIFYGLDQLKMSYPKVKVKEVRNSEKPSLLTVADSFYWQIFKSRIPDYIFGYHQFWFYNRTVYSDTKNPENYSTVQPQELYGQLKTNEVIMLLCTEANMDDLGFGFIEQSTTALKKGKAHYKNRILEIKATMRSSEGWLNQIKEKANERNISVNEMIEIDANYIYKEELRSGK